MSRVETEEGKCIVCGRSFSRRLKKGTKRYVKHIKKSNALTCSKECSKIYIRDYQKITGKNYRKK